MTSRALPLTAVAGINDDFGKPGNFDVPILGTCTTCHDTPHVGNHSVPAPLDIGIADPSAPVTRGGDGLHNLFGLPVGDMPVHTLSHRTSGELKGVTDPGRALNHRPVEGRRPLQGADPAGPGRTCTVLPQRVGRDAPRCRELLRPAIQPGTSEQQKAELVALLRTL